jgi:hypothetical protein
MCTAREAIVSARTQLINTVRGWMRCELLKIRSSRVTFPERVRSKALSAPCGLPVFIDQVLRVIEVQTEQIAQADTQRSGRLEIS